MELLRQTARSYISRILKFEWSSDGFSDIMEAAHELPDKELHEIMSVAVAEHIEEFIQMGDSALEDIIQYSPVRITKSITARLRKKHSELGSLRSEFEMLHLKYETLDSNVTCLNADIDYQTAEIDSMRADIDLISRILERAREALDGRQSCRARGCKARFNCFFEQREQGGPSDYELRCSLCRCRLQRSRK